MKFALLAFVLLVQTMPGGQAIAAGDTLVKETRQIRMGYFEGSAPFSSTGPDTSPQGYSVELCERVAAGIQRQLGLPQLKTVWVPLGLQDRIEAVRSGRIDIECGTTTWSFSRQQLVDFSLITFVDGASMLVTGDSGIKRMSDTGGKRIAVIRGTTTDRALAAALAKDAVNAEVVRVDSREQGVAMLTEGRADAFASDRFLLLNIAASIRSSRPLRLIDEDFSIEPYALAAGSTPGPPRRG